MFFFFLFLIFSVLSKILAGKSISDMTSVTQSVYFNGIKWYIKV